MQPSKNTVRWILDDLAWALWLAKDVRANVMSLNEMEGIWGEKIQETDSWLGGGNICSTTGHWGWIGKTSSCRPTLGRSWGWASYPETWLGLTKNQWPLFSPFFTGIKYEEAKEDQRLQGSGRLWWPQYPMPETRTGSRLWAGGSGGGRLRTCSPWLSSGSNWPYRSVLTFNISWCMAQGKV